MCIYLNTGESIYNTPTRTPTICKQVHTNSNRFRKMHKTSWRPDTGICMEFVCSCYLAELQLISQFVNCACTNILINANCRTNQDNATTSHRTFHGNLTILSTTWLHISTLFVWRHCVNDFAIIPLQNSFLYAVKMCVLS